MFYQLPNGKVIEMTTEQFVEMSDEELEYLIAFNYGDILAENYENFSLSEPFILTNSQPLKRILGKPLVFKGKYS